jgi:hypothetical protein
MTVSRGTDKPKKDFWDKADVVIKGVIGSFTVIAAVLVAIIGGKIQQAVTRQTGKIQESIASQTGKIQESIATQNTGKDYMQIALNILEKKDLTQDMQKNIGLRQWAVGLLKYYSPVTLDDNTADKLVRGQVEIPLVVHGGLQDFPWNEKDTVIKAPHGGPLASVDTEGVVRLEVQGGEGAYILDKSDIKSPRAYFSQNGEALFVYNNQKAVIYFTPDWSRGQPRIIPPIRISQPNGISNISFDDDGNIIVTGTDNKQTRYGLDGSEIK